MEFKYNNKTGMNEIEVDEFFIQYSTNNTLIYDVSVYDSRFLDDIRIMCDNEEFIRIINNPRLAFYL